MATTNSQTPPADPAVTVRADIIEAATRAFSEHGYDGASMAQIADAVGMRKASLYHHVRKKEDLLFAIHDQLIDELTAETTQAIAAANDPPEKLSASLRVAMAFVSRRRDAVTVFLQENRAVRGDRWVELVEKRNAYERMIQEIIADGTRSGHFINLPPEIASKAILAMANWGYTWFNPKGPMSADEVAEIFARIALKGLSAP